MLEIENTYLVRSDEYVPLITESIEIEQHYLREKGEGMLRLRRKGKKIELTTKVDAVAGDASQKIETNICLNEDEFSALVQLSKRMLRKTRHIVPLDGELVAEVDVYHGSLEGLSVVEVEFTDVQKQKEFLPPSWFGRDITQEDWCSNSNLAGKTFGEIASLMDKG